MKPALRAGGMLVSSEGTNAVLTAAKVRLFQKVDPVGCSCTGAMKDADRRREPCGEVIGVPRDEPHMACPEPRRREIDSHGHEESSSNA